MRVNTSVGRRMCMILPALFFMLYFCTGVYPVSLGFQETAGAVRLTNVSVMADEDGGVSLNTVLGTGSAFRYRLNRQGAVQSAAWTNRPSGEWFSMGRHGNIIQVTNAKAGEALRKIAIDDSPWFQDWGAGLGPFSLTGARALDFWSVDPLNPASYSKFHAVRLETETVRVMERDYSAVKIRIRVDGFPEFIWHADYWFRGCDGRELKNEVPRGFMAAPTRMELIREE